MAWTVPTTRTTSTLITAAIWNVDIEDNLTFLGTLHDHNGGSGDGGSFGALKSGWIAMFDAACPSGWTRVSAWDSKFLRGAAAYDVVGGGAATHTHTVAAHIHTNLGHTHDWNHTHTGPSHTHDQNTAGAIATAGETNYVKAGSVSGSAMFSGSGGTGDQRILMAGFAAGGTGATGSGTGATSNGGTADTGSGGNGTTGATSNLPAYLDIVYCKKN